VHPLPRFLQFEWYQTFSSDVPTNDIANPVVYRINVHLFYGLVLMRDGRERRRRRDFSSQKAIIN
jgi:hypothetical protein